jgi:hypothetical protein
MEKIDPTDIKAIGDAIMNLSLMDIRHMQQYMYECYTVNLTIITPYEQIPLQAGYAIGAHANLEKIGS